MTATLAYRDSLEGSRIRYAELLAERAVNPPLAGVSRVIAARTGRIWAGNAGIACAALLVLAAIGSLLQQDVPLTAILLLSWPTMLGAYATGCALGEHRARRRSAPAATGDVRVDLARLEAADPPSLVREQATELERTSMSRPMMAVALLAPLTIHFLVFDLLGHGTASSFDPWIKMSLLFVGHAHLALAAGCHRFAREAALSPGGALTQARSPAEWRAFEYAVVAAVFPSSLLALIPPVLTAATGLVFNPLLFRGMTRTIVAEREVLG